MSTIKLITVTNHPNHAEVLRRSAELQGWDCVVLEKPWRGFGTKIIETYNYLKDRPAIDSFIFCDAFDVVVLGNEAEFLEKLKHSGGVERIRLSTEKGLWPPILEPFRSRYSIETGFDFINSGLYYSKANTFKNLVERYEPKYETDDQFWFNMFWLLDNPGYNSLGASAILDKKQELFNSHSFIAKGEYTYNNGRVQIMGNEPVFIHSNGKTVDPKLDELVNKMLS